MFLFRLWEQDFSEIKTYINYLEQEGVINFREYFDEHPEAVVQCCRLAKNQKFQTARSPFSLWRV